MLSGMIHVTTATRTLRQYCGRSCLKRQHFPSIFLSKLVCFTVVGHTMSVRTYNPSVRVANWNEDICLKEDTLKDFLDKKERGELLIQKTNNLQNTILEKINLSPSYDGFVHFGDNVSIYNPETEVVLSANMPESKIYEAKVLEPPCNVSGSKLCTDPCIRNTFVATSSEDPGERGILRFGQAFYLKTLAGTGGDLCLESDNKTFMKCLKKSRHQEVVLTNNLSYLSAWKVLCFDPQERLETEGLPVPANKKVLICHCKTNQCLASLPDFSFRTPFGREYEVTALTCLNSHKAEIPINHWVFLKDQIGERLSAKTPARRPPTQGLSTAASQPLPQSYTDEPPVSSHVPNGHESRVSAPGDNTLTTSQ